MNFTHHDIARMLTKYPRKNTRNKTSIWPLIERIIAIIAIIYFAVVIYGKVVNSCLGQ